MSSCVQCFHSTKHAVTWFFFFKNHLSIKLFFSLYNEFIVTMFLFFGVCNNLDLFLQKLSKWKISLVSFYNELMDTLVFSFLVLLLQDSSKCKVFAFFILQ